MSNEYKEWEKDRAEEAWTDIDKIAVLIEKWKENGLNARDVMDTFFNIVNILEEGNWI